MGTITKPTTHVDGTVPTAAHFNNNFDTIYNEFNGNIENANIKASAGIPITKLDTTTVAGVSSTQTLTNKRITRRVSSTTSSATPTLNTDSYDALSITALATNITSMTTNLSGTPVNFDTLIVRIKDNGTARTIAWGASFEAKGFDLPTTTTASKVLTVGFLYDSVSGKWGCVAVSEEV